MTAAGLRRLLFLVHQYTGFIFAAYLIVVCGSGTILLLLENQIEGYRHYLMVRVPAGEKTVGLGAVVAAAAEANPRRTLRHVLLSCPSGCTYDVSFDYGDDRLDVLVDPYTGRIVKSVIWEQTAIGRLYGFHGSLFAGDTGETVNAAAGLSLVLMGCTGLYLWPGWRRLRQGFTIKWPPTQPFRLSYDVHKIVGIVSVAFLMMWALTAAGQVFWTDYAEPVSPAPAPTNATMQRGIDSIVAMGNAVLPGELTMVYRAGGLLVLRKRVPGDPDPYGYSYIAVNAATGALRQVYDARTFPLLWRVREAMYAVHIGSPGGPVLRALYAFFGLMPAVLFLTGFLMWRNNLKVRVP
ncbi:MAG TPA: PepSY-associated TM helix domain-containing protein [Candidatus Baltobacteraceae bacterium]|nr:PepSY-associated TM helix domain-containing protein [Candidatus Baltobacteraceae bacterium]